MVANVNPSALYDAITSGNKITANKIMYENAQNDTRYSTKDASGNLLKYNPTGSLAQAWDVNGNRIAPDKWAGLGIQNQNNLLKQQSSGLGKVNSGGMPKNPQYTPQQQAQQIIDAQRIKAEEQAKRDALSAQQFYAANPHLAPQMVDTPRGRLDARAGILYGAGNTKISDADIRTAIQGKSSDEILKLAVQHGVSAQQISNAMGGQGGYDMNNINKFLAGHGIRPPSPGASGPGAPTQGGIPQQPTTGGTSNQTTGMLGQRINSNYGTPVTPDSVINQGFNSGYQQSSVLQGLLGREVQAGQIARPDAATFQQISAPQQVRYNNAATAQSVIDPRTGTVEGRLPGLLDPNSVLMQRAQFLGQDRAAQAGLLNSSIAGTAAQAAMTDAALQIATPDAAAYNQAMLANTQARNTMGLANAQNQLQAQQINAANQLQANIANSELGAKVSMFNSDTKMRADMFNKELDVNTKKFNNELYTRAAQFDNELAFNQYKTQFDAANQVLLTKMNNQNAIDLENIRNKFNKELQNSSYAAGLYDNYFKMANDVFSRDIPEDAKQTILGNLNTMLKDGLTLTSGVLGLGEALNFNKGKGLDGMFNTGQGQPKVDYLKAPPTTMQSAANGQPLGTNPSNPSVVNTIGGFLPSNVADALQNVLKVDPRMVVTVAQKNSDPTMNQQIEAGLRNGTITRLTLEKLAGVKPGGMFGGSKKIYEGLDKAFTLLGGHVYYDPNNTLGRAANIQPVAQQPVPV